MSTDILIVSIDSLRYAVIFSTSSLSGCLDVMVLNSKLTFSFSVSSFFCKIFVANTLAASIYCGSFSKTKACKGVFVFWRFTSQKSRDAVSNVIIDGGGTVLFQKVYMLLLYKCSPFPSIYFVSVPPPPPVVSFQSPSG